MCRFAFQYNPSLQPRALVVFGCISKRVTHTQMKQIIRILSKASPLLSIDRVRTCLTLKQKHGLAMNMSHVSIHKLHRGLFLLCFGKVLIISVDNDVFCHLRRSVCLFSQGLESCLKSPDNCNSQVLIEATVIALTKLQPLLNKVSNYSILLKCVCEWDVHSPKGVLGAPY